MRKETKEYNLRMKDKILLTPEVVKWFTDNGFINYYKEWDDKNDWKGRVNSGWDRGCFYRIDNDIRIEIQWEHDYSCEEYGFWWGIKQDKITGKTKTKYVQADDRENGFLNMMWYIKTYSDEIIELLKNNLVVVEKSDIIYFTCTNTSNDEHLFDKTKIYLNIKVVKLNK